MALTRRHAGAGLLASAALAVAGCATGMGGTDLLAAVKRLLGLATTNGLAKLGAGGLADAVARGAGLSEAIGGMVGNGTAGQVVAVLDRLGVMRSVERKVAASVSGLADKAAPLLLDQIGTLSADDARQVINGSSDAATVLLRAAVGNRLKNLLLPEVSRALAGVNLLGDLAPALSIAGINSPGLNLDALASRVTGTVGDSVFAAIAAEERAIRANPQSTGDPLLIRVFGQKS